MNDYLMNEVVSRTRTLKPYKWNCRSIKKSGKMKISYFLGNVQRNCWFPFKIRYLTKLQIRSNNVVCVYQPTWAGYTERMDPSWMCEQCGCQRAYCPVLNTNTLRQLWLKDSIFQQTLLETSAFVENFCLKSCVFYFHHNICKPLMLENIWQLVKCRTKSGIEKLPKFWSYIWS